LAIPLYDSSKAAQHAYQLCFASTTSEQPVNRIWQPTNIDIYFRVLVTHLRKQVRSSKGLVASGLLRHCDGTLTSALTCHLLSAGSRPHRPPGAQALAECMEVSASSDSDVRPLLDRQQPTACLENEAACGTLRCIYVVVYSWRFQRQWSWWFVSTRYLKRVIRGGGSASLPIAGTSMSQLQHPCLEDDHLGLLKAESDHCCVTGGWQWHWA
jgi:hypothetical protein